MQKLSVFVLAIMAVVLSAAPSMAEDEQPNPRKPDSVYLGVFYPRTTFYSDLKGLDAGTGTGVRMGFARNAVATEISAFKTSHDVDAGPKVDFTGITLDLKLTLPMFPVVTPYGVAGLGRYVLESSQAVYRGNKDVSGVNGYDIGAGIDVYLSQNISLNMGYTKRRILFDSGTPGDTKMKTKAITTDFGVSVHFQ